MENGKTYVTKLIHAGSPENFAFKYEAGPEGTRANYILSSGTVGSDYNTLVTGGSSGIMCVDGNGNTRYALHQIIIILAYDL